MININENIKNIINGNGQKYTAKIVLENGTEITDDISELTIEYIGNNKMIGNIVTKVINFKLFNASLYNLTDKTITLYIYILGNEEKHEIKIGKFIIDSPVSKDIKKDEVSLKGKDYAYKLNTNIKELKKTITYPLTIRELIEKLTTIYPNIEYSNISNLNYSLSSEIYVENDLLGNLVKQVAEATSSNVYVDNEDRLIFRVINTNVKNYILNKKQLFEAKFSDIEVKGINTIVASRIKTASGTTEDIYYPEGIENKKEYKIIGNDVIDKNREGALPEILNVIKTVNYLGAEYECICMPFIEPFDVIEINDGTKIFNTVVHTLKHSINSGVSSIICNTESKTKTEYKKATTKEKTARAEFYVDKVLGEIKSTVTSETEKVIDKNIKNIEDSIEKKIEIKTTELKQSFEGFNYAISKLGGENLLKNSIMLDMDNNIPKNWTLEEGGSLITEVDAHASERGAVTGNVFILNGKTIRQRIEVKKHTDINKVKYSFSTRIKKGYVGRCYIKIFNDLEQHIIEVPDSTKKDYEEFSIEGLTPKTDYYIIEFYSDSGTNTRFTDNMFVLSERKQSWKQANGESNAKMVNITNEGIIVKTDKQDENYKITNVGITGYGKENGQVVEKVIINSDKIYGEKLGARSGLSIPPLQIVPIFNNENLGWAIVETPVDRR